MRKGVLDRLVLILNKNWTPIRIKDVKKAILLICRERAVFVDENNYELYNWEEWLKIIPEKEGISTTKGLVKIPEIVLLIEYGKVPVKTPKLTKRNIFIRDEFTCQYTGKKVSMKEANTDHVIPVSKKGKSTWENMVVSTKKINSFKGNRTPEEAGLKLLKKPKRPKGSQLLIDPRIKIPESWKKFIKK